MKLNYSFTLTFTLYSFYVYQATAPLGAPEPIFKGRRETSSSSEYTEALSDIDSMRTSQSGLRRLRVTRVLRDSGGWLLDLPGFRDKEDSESHKQGCKNLGAKGQILAIKFY